jgi:enoyl-CoA hydratase/carnithine racemase
VLFRSTLTARRIGGEEALRAGLLNQLVAADAVLDAAVDIATQIAAHPPAGVHGHKALLQASLDRSLEAAYAAENALMADSFKPASPSALFDGVLGKKSAS